MAVFVTTPIELVRNRRDTIKISIKQNLDWKERFESQKYRDEYEADKSHTLENPDRALREINENIKELEVELDVFNKFILNNDGGVNPVKN